ncbi:MAG: hypothetical protein AAGI68_16515 [Planctomycetota bacterium]
MIVLINLLVIIVVLMVVAGFLFVPFALLWWGLIAWRKPTRRWAWWLCALPVYGILFLSSVTAAYMWMTRPAAVFEMTFGFPPTNSVRQLESSQFILGDSGERHLRFQADPAVGQRIVASRTWQRVDTFNDHDADAPSWWRPSSGPSVELYQAELTGEQFGTIEMAFLWFDPTTGDVWYWWYGID